MKKTLALILVITALLVSACAASGIEPAPVQTDDQIEETAAPLPSENKSIIVQGEFAARIIDIIPDYVEDDRPRILLAALFQSKPFLLELPEELLTEVSAGKAYLFKLQSKKLDENERRLLQGNEEYTSHLPLHVQIPLFGLTIASVEEAEDFGMGTSDNRIIFE
jgi:hypothetical protein